MKWRRHLLVGAATVVVPVVMAVSGGPVAGTAGAAEASRASDDRVVVRGRAVLDGVPFDARYMGAVVRRHGLVTPCQVTLPVVLVGRYEIRVYARTEEAGCGAPGADIFLWTYVRGRILYSSESVRWPGNGATAKFRPRFSPAAPDGGVGPTVGFAGEVFDRRGRRQPPGTHVAAYIGPARCGVASIRRTGNFTGFSLDVVGPDSIPACTQGAIISFRVNGRRAVETAVNEPGHGTSLDLSLA